jgi:colanic acid biosynthesis protein WcaH
MKKNYIEENDYKRILDTMPVSCVDIILYNSKQEILFLKRNTEPAKNELWLPGGRIYKNETLLDAAKRKVMEEIGIEIEDLKYLTTGETIFDVGPFEKISTHTINSVFYSYLDENVNLNIDKFHDEYKFTTELEKNANSYLVDSILKFKEIMKNE